MAERSMWDRMRGAAMLDIATYEEVEHDTTATMQAGAVVVIHALAQAIGNWQLGVTAAFTGAVGALLAITAVTWGVADFVDALTFYPGPLFLIPSPSWIDLLSRFQVVERSHAIPSFDTGRRVTTIQPPPHSWGRRRYHCRYPRRSLRPHRSHH